MSKSELKTKMNDASVSSYLQSITDPNQQADCKLISKFTQEITGVEPVMWGESIIGFGTYHYKYASGREGDWMRIGLSPRKGKTTLYFCSGLEPYQSLLATLGPHSTGKGCLYIKHLDDIDQKVLKKLIRACYEAPALGETQ